MIAIKFIKEVEILSSITKVVYDKTNNGGSFSLSKATMTIGIKDYATDPLYTFSVISHEIMESILCYMGARFDSTRTRENYLFSFDHQTFENAIQLHTQIISKFIK